MHKLSLLALCFCAIPAMAADIYTFSPLPPDGNIQGAPGSTIGWGYTIQNESSEHWLVTTGLNAGSFQDATPNAIFDFPDLAPGATVTIPFDASNSTGLYEITWDASAPLGLTNAGNFVLDAAWFNGDPSAGGTFFNNALNGVQPYTATTATPEPATVGVVAISILLIAARLRAQRRRIRSTGNS
jgi:hypothetical protein